jgi:H+-transporting ATPase
MLFVVLELIIVFGVRNGVCDAVGNCAGLENAIVLIVGGIPIAMPTVLSVTMAVGAQQLAKKQAIVSRLTAVEELAGMDILCSDKTGIPQNSQFLTFQELSQKTNLHLPIPSLMVVSSHRP